MIVVLRTPSVAQRLAAGVLPTEAAGAELDAPRPSPPSSRC